MIKQCVQWEGHLGHLWEVDSEGSWKNGWLRTLSPSQPDHLLPRLQVSRLPWSRSRWQAQNGASLVFKSHNGRGKETQFLSGKIPFTCSPCNDIQGQENAWRRKKENWIPLPFMSTQRKLLKELSIKMLHSDDIHLCPYKDLISSFILANKCNFLLTYFFNKIKSVGF